MTISIKDVEHVAGLARLSLTEDEKNQYARHLTRILEHFAALKDIDTTDILPMAHALPVVNVTRPDEVKRSFTREELMKNAPDRQGEFFRVPKIGE